MVLTLSQVTRSLLEIVFAKKVEGRCVYIGDSYGSVWDAGQGYGKIFATVTWLSAWNSVDSYKEQTKRAVRRTASAFRAHIAELDTYCTAAETAISTGYTEGSHPLMQGHWRNISKHLSLIQLFHGANASKHLKVIHSLFRCILGGSGTEAALPPRCLMILRRAEDQMKLKLISHFLNYTDRLGNQFPYALISKCSLDEDLSDVERRIVRDLSRRINRFRVQVTETSFRSTMTLGDLWRVVRLVIHRSDPVREGITPQVLMFGKKVEELGLKIFDQSDLTYREKWLKGLSDGTRKKVEINRKVYVLDGLVERPRSDTDGNLVFSIQGDQHNIFIASRKNPWALAQEQAMIKEKNWGLAMREITQLDSRGFGAIMPRLDGHPDEQAWAETLTTEDCARRNCISAYVSECKTNSITPKDITARSVMFTFDHELRFLRILEKVNTFDHVQFEKFIWSCSATREHVYTKIMIDAEMDNHLVARFYKSVFRAAIAGRVFLVAEEAYDTGIRSRKVHDAALTLQASVVRIKGEAFAATARYFPSRLHNGIKERVSALMQSLYNSDHSGFIVMPSMKRRIVARCRTEFGTE